jgi:myo-inositol-1(or 4)-monophosphatase
MTPVPPAELVTARATLERAVRAAGALQVKEGATFDVELKGEGDLLTSVDTACEAVVADLIREAHPRHVLLAEEGTGVRTGSSGEGPLWILDPLDGTKNFVHGLPRFACALALQWDGEMVLGAVFDPNADELFAAERGAGATLNGRPIRVSATANLDQALVASALTVRRRFASHHFDRLERLARLAQGVRIGGCASLDLCDVARGRLDAYFEEGLDPWDTAAGALIVREAGGSVTAFGGERHDPFGSETLASNGPVGLAITDCLRGETRR